MRCSFCGKNQDQVKRLIPGPAVHICNECVDICNEIIADDNRIQELSMEYAPLDDRIEIAVQCSICRMPCPVTEALLITELGQLCAGCTAAVRSALDEPETSH